MANLQLLNNLAIMSKRQSALLQVRMIIFVAAKMECVGGRFGTAKLILSLENYTFFCSFSFSRNFKNKVMIANCSYSDCKIYVCICKRRAYLL